VCYRTELHARIHGFGDRELYKFDEPVVRIGRKFLHLRMTGS
jgi:hypothetical protein